MPVGERKRIGLFTQAWDFGGVCTFCNNLGSGLAAAGHEVTYILARAHKRGDPHAQRAFRAWEQEVPGTILDLGLQWVPRALRRRYFENRVVNANLDAIVLSNPDHFLPSFERLSAGHRLISVGHGDLASGTYRMFAQMQDFCHRHVAISRAIYESLLLMSPPETHREIAFIPHGVEPGLEPPLERNDDHLQVVYCGRFDPVQKRIGDLPKLWKAFSNLGGKGTLHLVGAGQGEEMLRREFASEIATGAVVMHGFVLPAQVMAILRQCEVILNLSRWEGLPFSILEGMSAGCYPLLSSIRSGHSDILETCGGEVFPTGDMAQLALLLNGLRLDKKRLQARRLAVWLNARKHFNRAEMTEHYLELIESP